MAVDLSQRRKAVNNGEARSRIDRITATLAGIDSGDVLPDCVIETPGLFLLEFYKAWVENGGQDGGKNRNSIRRMRDRWLINDSEVKSLHPKLTGRIRISKSDARSLMGLFLGRWKFVSVKEGDWGLTPDGYAPFPCEDCQKLCDRLVDVMYPEGGELALHGLLLPVKASGDDLGDLHAEWANVAKVYRESDCIINFSRHRVALGETPPETMRLFWHLFENFYETMEERNQIFIWIIDIGSRQVEDEEAWAEFFNFEMLKAQFRAFATFDAAGDADDSGAENAPKKPAKDQRSSIHDAFLRSLTIPERTHREKRWNWLCDHTVIMIQNLRKEEFNQLYKEQDEGIDDIRLKDIGVTAENILPKMLPPAWARDRHLKDLYGANLETVTEATLTAFLKQDGWKSEEVPSKQSGVDVRYFAHALTHRQASATNPDLAATANSRELDSPGDVYDEAFRIVYWAARHRLVSGSEGGGRNGDWAIAVAYLNNQGFRTLRLSDFLAIHRTPFG